MIFTCLVQWPQSLGYRDVVAERENSDSDSLRLNVQRRTVDEGFEIGQGMSKLVNSEVNMASPVDTKPVVSMGRSRRRFPKGHRRYLHNRYLVHRSPEIISDSDIISSSSGHEKRNANNATTVAREVAKGNENTAKMADKMEPGLFRPMNTRLVELKPPSAPFSGDPDINQNEREVVEVPVRPVPMATSKVLASDPPGVDYLLKPAGDCDLYEADINTCWYERTVGESITLSVYSVRETEFTHIIVEWTWNFKVLKRNKTVSLLIDHDNPPWNINVGSYGKELRVSPLTNADFHFNSFSARLLYPKEIDAEVMFNIKIKPIDMDYLYVGEDIMIHVENFISLPPESMLFDWKMEINGETFDLPSNMKVSHTGRSVSIRELRLMEDSILTCSAYTTKKLFVAMRSFQLQRPDKEYLSKNVSSRAIEKRHLRSAIVSRAIPDGLKNSSTKSSSQKEKDISQLESEDEGLDVGDLPSGPKEREQADVESVFLNSKEITETFRSKGSGAMPGNKKGLNSRLPGVEDSWVTPSPKTDMDTIEAQLVSSCGNDRQCSNHATCAALTPVKRGYCKCIKGFHGNGIFCLEKNYIPSGV